MVSPVKRAIVFLGELSDRPFGNWGSIAQPIVSSVDLVAIAFLGELSDRLFGNGDDRSQLFNSTGLAFPEVG